MLNLDKLRNFFSKPEPVEKIEEIQEPKVTQHRITFTLCDDGMVQMNLDMADAESKEDLTAQLAYLLYMIQSPEMTEYMSNYVMEYFEALGNPNIGIDTVIRWNDIFMGQKSIQDATPKIHPSRVFSKKE